MLAVIDMYIHSLCMIRWIESMCACPMAGHVRLRAAIFINACAMRDAMSLRHGPLLCNTNLQKNETANYLFQSALN